MTQGLVISDPFNVQPSTIRTSAGLVSAGRYRLPNRDGTPHKGGWTRATNLASSISDTKALGDWEQRMVLLGMREALRHVVGSSTLDLLLADHPVRELLELDVDNLEPGELRGALMSLAETFKTLAKSELGATRGNLAHKMVEHHHAGLPMAGIPQEVLDKLPHYVTRLEVHKLEPIPGMQERQVMVEELNGVGTLDNILRDLTMAQEPCFELELGGMCTKHHRHISRCGFTYPALSPWTDTCPDFIGDLKTQKRFWSWLEIAAQLAFYAHGDAMWDPKAGAWVDMPPVNQERALVAWMPWEAEEGASPVEMYEVNLLEGWETLKLAHQVHARRAAAKRKSEAWGWLRTPPRAGIVEAYAKRLHEAVTRADASAIYAEASGVGVWGPELEQVAAEILPRLVDSPSAVH